MTSAPRDSAGSLRVVGLGLAISAAYFIAAITGFTFAFVAEQVTTVWAPTGIGIAALLMAGPAMWPAIWLGAFGANAVTDAPLWTAAIVASGNTLEAVAASWGLRQLPHFNHTLRRVRDVLAYVLIGVGLSTMVSASIGVIALCAAAVQPWDRFSELWREWWFGDAVGALIVGPVILTITGQRAWSRRSWAEAVLLVSGAALTTQLVFGATSGLAAHPLEYVIFPFVVAAAMRAGQPVTALVVFAASAVSIWHTVHGIGPFASPNVHESLVLVQAFMAVLGGTGLVLAAAMAERDTGERRRVEAEREREQLLVREAKARSEAEAANRAKDEFLATLSHELRTPLNAIVGWTRLLLDGRMDEQTSRRALEVIDRNAHLQAQLVSDIFDVSRIITGGARLNLRPMDPETVVGAALDAVRPAAAAKNIQLRSRLAASGRLVHGDPERLQQVVWNLLANAVKFTGPGGMVTVSVLEGSVGVVCIRVSDDGVGIDPDFLPHVFERFRQADGTLSRQHGGLGLGLAIVRQLVELHGGRVYAESPGVGQGSTFTVELPEMVDSRHPAPMDHDPSPFHSGAAPASNALHGYRLLVVEDHQDTRELMAALLSSLGAEIETVSSVAEALQRLDVTQPDVLLADLGMPVADGYDLIREVRRRDARNRRRLPACAITAYASEEDRARALSAGFDCYMPKPIDASTVIAAVLSVCPGKDHVV
jgi:signal transduction histidine kinase/CheY-like chemotaxis protein